MAKKISAAKTAAPKRTVKTALAKKKPLSVSIDYPKDAERVRPGHYSIRLTASLASSAQVRVDGGDWLDCRQAVGHFWLDWSPAAGNALVEARARSGKGRWAAAPVRSIVVVDGWSTN